MLHCNQAIVSWCSAHIALNTRCESGELIALEESKDGAMIMRRITWQAL
jgi:hypothetical protein